MTAYTISFAKGSGCIRHNNRNFIAKDSLIDPNKTHENVILVKDEIQDVYHELFDHALAKYNETQISKHHPERQIENYYEHIEASRQEKSFHEIIIQIGNKDSMPKQETSVSIMKEYLENFRKLNPHLRVFNAVIHLDETTPHMHIDYVPYITEQKRGLETRVSHDKALKKDGYDSWQQWRSKNIEQIAEVMKKHDLEHEITHNTDVHLSISAYKTLQKAVESKISDVLAKEVELPMAHVKTSLTGKKTVNFADYENLRRQNIEYRKTNLEYRDIIDQSQEAINKVEKRLKDYRSRSYVQENEKLHEEKFKLEQSIEHQNIHQENLEKLADLYSKKIKDLTFQVHISDNEIKHLKRELDASVPKRDFEKLQENFEKLSNCLDACTELLAKEKDISLEQAVKEVSRYMAQRNREIEKEIEKYLSPDKDDFELSL